MKKVIIAALLIFFGLNVSAQEKKENKYEGKAKVSCGQCQFKLEGKGCELAVKIGDKAYFVEGKKIDDFGDAHADDGMCNAVHDAEVKGKIRDNKFYASSIKLVKTEK